MVMTVKEQIWRLGFSSEVFKKSTKSAKAKGIDIALTKDMLSNAFLNNYDVAVLITGDADYVPVLSEVKRLGKLVYVLAFVEGAAKIATELRITADRFFSLDGAFQERWELAFPK
jgi:uncharacterized LabA/DUF88 family protein